MGNRAQVLIELVVALGFLIAALAGLWFMPWIIPVAYVLHGMWDYAHRKNSSFVPIPLWYPSFCAVYDFVAAGGLAIIWSLRV